VTLLTATRLKSITRLIALFSFSFSSLMTTNLVAGPGGYKKATEGDDVVKNKLYAKKGKIEINGPNIGTIMNQSYLNSFLVNGGINYFWSEAWGLGLDFSYVINQDRDERNCVEKFYNDPDGDVPDECGDESNIQGTKSANYGPAYVNIREYNYIFGANAIWNPIYGKEIFFLSAVGYFDVFITAGAGLAQTTFYPESTTLRNNKQSRSGAKPGAAAGETTSDGLLVYGPEGRPTPVQESKILIESGIGQKFHFGKNFNLKAELRDHIVVGTPNGFDLMFTLWGGLGYRF
jgi:outer membrane beta-barrel protein